LTKPLPSKTEKLMVFFGGFDCVSSCMEKHAEAQEKKRRQKSPATPIRISELVGPISEMRKKILDTLNARADVEHVCDLYDRPVIDIHSMSLFEPIVFDLRIPPSTQRMSHGLLSDDSASVQDFTLAYDGKVLMIAAFTPLRKRPRGILDARDKFEELLKSTCDAEHCAPCMTHQAIVFVRERTPFRQDQGDVYLPFIAGLDKIGHLRRLHTTLGRQLVQFYTATALRLDATRTAIGIQTTERDLLKEKKSFMTAKWYHPIAKKRIEGGLRRLCVEILASISAYLVHARGLSEARQAVQEDMAHNALFKRLMDAVKVEEYTSAESVDVESVMKVVEHVERELETYSINSSSVVSAILGGVVGSLLGILASYATGFLR